MEHVKFNTNCLDVLRLVLLLKLTKVSLVSPHLYKTTNLAPAGLPCVIEQTLIQPSYNFITISIHPFDFSLIRLRDLATSMETKLEGKKNRVMSRI